MARNRRCQSAAIRFGPALKAFLLCLLIGGSGVGYVWQKNQIFQLALQIHRREVLLEKVVADNDRLQRQLTTMRSPAWLRERIKDLGLAQPEQSQVWRLTEPTLERWQARGSLAAQNATPTHGP
jgi:hypothetical protein